MSKSSELDKTVKLYILSCIDASGYQENEPQTTQDKIDFLRDTFYSEKGYTVKQIGEVNAIKEWLQGLPTCLHIEFMNYRILELAKLWGSLPENASEKQEDKILENYFNLLSNKICQLFSGYRIPKTGD